MTKNDVQTLLADLPNLNARIDKEKFFEKFVVQHEPEGELGADATMEEKIVRENATSYLVNRNTGRLPIELIKADEHAYTIYQDLIDGYIYLDEDGDEPLPDEVQDKLIAQSVVVSDVDNKDSYNEFAGLEIDGFLDDDGE